MTPNTKTKEELHFGTYDLFQMIKVPEIYLNQGQHILIDPMHQGPCSVNVDLNYQQAARYLYFFQH